MRNCEPFTQDGITVVVHVASDEHQKCTRCSKYVPSVDSDPVFAMICDRCASAMHTLFYDVVHDVHFYDEHNVRRTYRPPALVNITAEEFISKYVRSELQHLTFDEIQQKFA